ncbi:DUF2628 domain-containing protein [uncultured Roseibium sp.]|uniref:DUF2628 domain-containing protein n=1 Tax=uncultured Roseibium sp. TaxID=1936171 RepID=UPI0032174DC1
MSTYMVMAPPDVRDPAASPEAADRLVFIADRFSWFAFGFSVIYLLWHRMWLVLLGYLVVATALELAAAMIGDAAPAVATLAISLLFAFEANGLRRWTLERKGWRMIAVACGADVEEAELRFFRGLEDEAPKAPETPAPPHPTAHPIIPRIGTEHVVGLTFGQETRR